MHTPHTHTHTHTHTHYAHTHTHTMRTHTHTHTHTMRAHTLCAHTHTPHTHHIHTHTHTHTHTHQVQWLLFSQHYSLLCVSGVSWSRPFLSWLHLPWCCQAVDTGWTGSMVGSGCYLIISRTDQPGRKLQLGTILLDHLVCMLCLSHVLHLPCILNVITVHH